MSEYVVRIDGHLDEHWSEALGGVVVRHEEDGTSTLSGVADQAQLHGVLTRLRDIGATLVSVSAAEASSPARSPLDAVAWPVRASRLILRPARPEDADATWRFRSLEAVGRWLTGVPDDLAAYRRSFADPARLANTLVIEREGAIIGDLMLRVEDAWAQAEVAEQAVGTQAELGWVLDPAHTGAGYATEAVRELLRLCFEDLGLRRVVAGCFAENTASWRLMERLGMRREQHALADALHRDGRWADSYGYAMLAEEFRRENSQYVL